MSIERRVARAFVGLMAVAAVFYAGIVILVAYMVEDEIIDRLLNDEIGYLQERHAATGQLPNARLSFFAIYDNAQGAPAPVARVLARSPERREIFTGDNRHFHVRYIDLPDRSDVLLVAEVSELLVVTNASRQLLLILVLLLTMLVGAAVWLAYRVARQTTQPIVRLSEEVQRGQHSGKALQLASAGQHGEVGYLANVIQTSFNQLRRAMEREHHFTRDVSHELRTPLTVARNTLSMMSDRPVEAADIELLRGAVSHMQATVAALLGLAREATQPLASVSLRPVVEDSVLSLNATLERSGFSVAVALPDRAVVLGNTQLIFLLVTNLIENALQYAADPHLDISLDGNVLRFSNTVFEPVVGDVTSPSRKHVRSEGLGQGLFLVKRIAQALDWQLATNTQDTKFVVSLILPQ